MSGKVTKIAIFDIDGTIFRSSLVIQLSRALVEAKVFPKSAQEEIKLEFSAWLDRKGSYEAYIAKVVKIYVKYIAGKDFEKVRQAAGKVVSFQKDRVYTYTRDLIKTLKKRGYFLVAISGSPSYIVGPYAHEMGFDLFFGTELEVRNGKFTGRELNLDSAYSKSRIINALIQKYPWVDLKKSLAVGDTESDIDMLSLVGQPIAFNPNMRLAKIAKKRGWKIVLERKDVVLEIKKSNFLN